MMSLSSLMPRSRVIEITLRSTNSFVDALSNVYIHGISWLVLRVRRRRKKNNNLTEITYFYLMLLGWNNAKTRCADCSLVCSISATIEFDIHYRTQTWWNFNVVAGNIIQRWIHLPDLPHQFRVNQFIDVPQLSFYSKQSHLAIAASTATFSSSTLTHFNFNLFHPNLHLVFSSNKFVQISLHGSRQLGWSCKTERSHE